MNTHRVLYVIGRRFAAASGKDGTPASFLADWGFTPPGKALPQNLHLGASALDRTFLLQYGHGTMEGDGVEMFRLVQVAAGGREAEIDVGVICSELSLPKNGRVTMRCRGVIIADWEFQCQPWTGKSIAEFPLGVAQRAHALLAPPPPPVAEPRSEAAPPGTPRVCVPGDLPALHAERFRIFSNQACGKAVAEIAREWSIASSLVYQYLALEKLDPALLPFLDPPTPRKERLTLRSAAFLARKVPFRLHYNAYLHAKRGRTAAERAARIKKAAIPVHLPPKKKKKQLAAA